MSGNFSPAAFNRELSLRGLSLRDFSRISGVHEISLCRYRTGHTEPSSRTLTRVAIALSRVPVLPVDLTGEAKVAGAPTTPTTSEEGSRASGRTP